MDKTVQNIKVEIESIKKTQIEGNLEMINLANQTGTLEASLTNKIQDGKENLTH